MISNMQSTQLRRFQTAEPDQILAARVVLRDWNTGKFPRFTLPPCSTPASETTDAALAKVYAKDDSVLSWLKTRSGFRKSLGLVKMNSGNINRRTVILDAKWVSPEDSETSEDEDGNEEMLDFRGIDGDDEDGDEDEDEEEDEDEGRSGVEEEEEDQEEEEEEESEVELPPLPSKRKRPAVPSKAPAAPPKKKVTFALQRPAKGAGSPPKHTPPNPNVKASTLAPSRRR